MANAGRGEETASMDEEVLFARCVDRGWGRDALLIRA
jgi:hypothetical protein